MRLKIKQLLSVLLCVCMVLSLLPQLAFAAEITCESHDFDENYFCSQCGKTYVASVNGKFYQTLDEAWIAANKLTNYGKHVTEVQLALHADATLRYDYYTSCGVLWEGTSFTIDEGVTLTTDHLTVRDVMTNYGTIRACEDVTEPHLQTNYTNYGGCGILNGDGEYYIPLKCNGGIINGGIFYEDVCSIDEINNGTFLGKVTLNYVGSAIHAGTFQDVVLEYGTLYCDPAVVAINGVVYDYSSTGNTAILKNGVAHTHLPGEVTYEKLDGDTHNVLTHCDDCLFETYMVEREEHTYVSGRCICNEPKGYDLYVGGIEVTEENRTDILSDGTASYDPETYTLTLDHADIRNAVVPEFNGGLGIFVAGVNPLNISLIGDNYISAADHAELSLGCYTLGTLSFSGSGTLTVESGNAQMSLALFAADLVVDEDTTIYANGVSAMLNLQNNGNLNTIAVNPNIMCDYIVYGNAVMKNSLTVNGTDNSDETYATFTIPEGTTLTIKDGATLTIADGSDLREGVQNVITNSGKIILEGSGAIVNNGVGTCTETATHCPGADFSCLICGEKAEAVLDESLRFSMNITAGAEMRVYYHIMSSVVSTYENFYLEVKKDTAEGEPVVVTYGLKGDHIALGNMSDFIYYATYTGIAAKEMGDNFSATLYAIDKDGNVYCSNTVTSSIKDFLLSRFNEKEATDETKTMAIDMLKYGAAAQVRFDYRTDELVTDGLTEEQLSCATEGSPEATDVYAESGDGANVAMNVTVGSRVELYVSVNLDGITDTDTIRCEIRDSKGNLIAEPAVSNTAENVFMASYGDVGAREMRKPIEVTFYNGETAVSKTITWSVESYVARERSAEGATQAQIDVVNAMLTYGDSVGAYLTAIGV